MVQTRQALIQNSVGKKIVMALTGAMMVAFVVAHMVGNLLVFQGEKALDDYGWLPQEGTHGLVWVVRFTMLGALLAHLWAMVGVVGSQQSARKVAYAGGRKNHRTNYAAITMRYGGPVLLLFIIYHLLHFTTGHAHHDFVRGEVYHNLVTGLGQPVNAVVYMAAMVALGLHLFHGIWSGLRTLGLPESWDNVGRNLSIGIAALVFTGNTAIVTYIQLIRYGILQEIE